MLCSYAISHEKGRDVKKLTRFCVVNRSTSQNLCCKRCKTIPNLSSASAIFNHLTKIMTWAHDTKIIEMKSLLHALWQSNMWKNGSHMGACLFLEDIFWQLPSQNKATLRPTTLARFQLVCKIRYYDIFLWKTITIKDVVYCDIDTWPRNPIEKQ